MAMDIPVLTFELRDPLHIGRRRPRPAARVDLGLVHPDPQRLGAHAELAGHPGDHPVALTGLLAPNGTGVLITVDEIHRGAIDDLREITTVLETEPK